MSGVEQSHADLPLEQAAYEAHAVGRGAHPMQARHNWINWTSESERAAWRAVVYALQQHAAGPPTKSQRFWAGAVSQLQLEVYALRKDLVAAAETLRRYEQHHRDKGTEESIAKAEVNRQLAERFERTLAGSSAEIVPPDAA